MKDFVLEDYFDRPVTAHGLFFDRFGRLRRRFTVEIACAFDGSVLTLDERFHYDDGVKDRRVWRVEKRGPGRYSGTADGVHGEAQGIVEGDEFRWRYVVDLSLFGRMVAVEFDDRMFLQSDAIVFNRATVRKWGIALGEAIIVFVRPAAAGSKQAVEAAE